MLCEAFGYRLREALWEVYGVEWEQAPPSLHWTILEMRGYVQAYHAVKSGDDEAKRRHPMTAKVYEVMRLIAEEKRKRHESGSACHSNQSGGSSLS